MATSFTPSVSADAESEQVSTGTFRRAGYALAISAAVHAVVVMVLSLIALTVVTDASPVITMFFAGDNGDSAQNQFELTPEISLEPAQEIEESPDISVDIGEPAELPEDLPNSIFGTMAASADSSTSGSAANSGVSAAQVSEIQQRVRKAGGRRGEVQFALAWKNTNDVDLHVIAPSGERISYAHKQSNCRGELDVDMNVDGESTEPVENVRWLDRSAPSGRYTVIVNLFRLYDPGSGRGHTDYELLAQLGPETEIIEDSVAAGRGVLVHRFRYVPHSVQGQRRRLMMQRFDRLQEDDERRGSALLERAQQQNGDEREKTLREVAGKYPHSDAAIEALKMMSGVTTK